RSSIMSSDSTRAELAVQRRDFVDARAVQLGLLDEPARKSASAAMNVSSLCSEFSTSSSEARRRDRHGGRGSLRPAPGSQLWSSPRAARQQSEGLTGETGFPP